MKSLALEKNKSRGLFHTKDTSKLDADLTDLQQRKKPLVAEKEREHAEETRSEI